MNRMACSLALLACACICASAQEETLLSDETLEIAGMTFSVPNGWKVEEPRSSSMIRRLAQIQLSRAEGDEEDAELTVIQAGGSVEANLERWKGQFASSAEEEEKGSREKIQVAGHSATILTLYGTYSVPPFMRRGQQGPAEQPGRGMIGIVLETKPQMTFVKVSGPARTIESHRERVLAFLRSAKESN